MFDVLNAWLEQASAPESPPANHDWGQLGDLMFWVGFLEAEGAIPRALLAMEIDPWQ